MDEIKLDLPDGTVLRAVACPDPNYPAINLYWTNRETGLDEEFKFNCTMCGKCCINREDILLNPKDMFNLAKELNMEPKQVLEAYCETYIGSDSRFPIVRLKPKGSIKRCPLLKDRKCSVHKAKPTVCAMFPIGRCVFCIDKLLL